MARQPTLTVKASQELGAEKLATLVLEEAERNNGFRRQVKAALAGRAGLAAIAKLIDRRLSGLERARSFVESDRVRAFQNDLRSLVDTIVSELAPASAYLAADRLLRFVATHESVVERTDDSHGYIQDIYWEAIEAIGDVASKLDKTQLEGLPDQVMAKLGESSHGYLTDVARMIVPHLPPDTLSQWDNALKDAISERTTEEAKRDTDRWFYSMTSHWTEIRQRIAEARGDLDLLMELETQKYPRHQETLHIATLLLEAGRAKEALDWVRNRPDSTSTRLAEDDVGPAQHVRLEAKILRALNDTKGAQDLLWKAFQSRLSADVLKDYLGLLPDFDDIEAEDRAHDLALNHKFPHLALEFFMAWPSHERAAQLIIKHQQHWDGGAWHILPDIAAVLEHDHPLAAAILYRALLNNILSKARSKAYSHGARYLRLLSLFADDANADPTRPDGFPDHATYLVDLKTTHGR